MLGTACPTACSLSRPDRSVRRVCGYLHPWNGALRSLTPRLTVHSQATVVAEADLRGDITIGSGTLTAYPGTVIHPRAKIDASHAPIRLGDNCIVEEGAELVSTPEGMKIGDGNLFRVGCSVASKQVGNCNIFEPKCRVPSQVCVADFCTVGAGCNLMQDEGTLTERTVVYGEENTRRLWSGEGVGQRLAQHAKQLQYLRDTLPQAHKLRMIR